MKHIYHIGLHCTDDDAILNCLLANRQRLNESGIRVPDPARSRPAVQKAMIDLRGTPASVAQQAQLLADMGVEPGGTRLVLSNSSFLCVPKRAMKGGDFYPLAAERATWIRNLFPEAPTEFAIALRNPAALVPALHARFRDGESFADLLKRIRPLEFSAADMVAQMREALPDCDLVIWCNEDVPLIWPEILRAISGVPEVSAFSGLTDMPAGLLAGDGGEGLGADAPPTDADWTRRVSEALARHGDPDLLEATFDLPGWTDDLVGQLTWYYEEDVKAIRSMPGVAFLGTNTRDMAA